MHLRTLVTMLAATLALAGCADEPAADRADPVEDGQEALPPLPDDFTLNETMPLSIDQTFLVNVDGETFCDDPTMVCHRYPVELPRNATVTAFLEWAFPGANDLDLYLVQGKDEVVRSGYAIGAAYKEFIRTEVEAGAYEVIVQGFTSTATPPDPTQGTPYTLAVWFDEPSSPNP